MSREPKDQGKRIENATEPTEPLVVRHLRIGWWTLFAYLLLGLVLEALHGFKVGWYLETVHASRRFALTLAHAHGTLLALVNLAFSAALPRLPAWSPRSRAWAGHALLGATILLPGGFFLGGLFPYAGDPGPGIFLVPVGGALLAWAVLVVALASRGATRG